MKEHIQKLLAAWKEYRIRRFMVSVGAFAHANPNLLLILGDPKDNTLYISYKDKHCGGIISSEDGKDYKVVENVLKASKFDKQGMSDRFLVALATEMQVAFANPYFQELAKFVDGALYNITKQLKFKKD